MVFLIVGQIIERKGLRQFIEATKLLFEAALRDNWSVLIVGDGPLKGELEAMVQICNLEDRVKFLGQVKYEELGRILSSAHVFVFPTLEDVWGVAPIEAMAMGMPVLCSKYAGASELVDDGVNGWIFDPHNPKELSEFMKRFVDYPILISTMSESA
jgi:glycosyltransferase involved in cell wall biosynthesis